MEPLTPTCLTIARSGLGHRCALRQPGHSFGLCRIAFQYYHATKYGRRSWRVHRRVRSRVRAHQEHRPLHRVVPSCAHDSPASHRSSVPMALGPLVAAPLVIDRLIEAFRGDLGTRGDSGRIMDRNGAFIDPTSRRRAIRLTHLRVIVTTGDGGWFLTTGHDPSLDARTGPSRTALRSLASILYPARGWAAPLPFHGLVSFWLESAE